MYDNAGKEIDFIASKAGKEYLIQVAHSVVSVPIVSRSNKK